MRKKTFHIFGAVTLLLGVPVTLGGYAVLTGAIGGGHPVDRDATNLAGLRQAIEGFESIYGRFPDVGSSDFEVKGPEGTALCDILQGKEPMGSVMQNPKQIRFLNIEEANATKGGLRRNALGQAEGIHDRAGNPFRVVLKKKSATSLEFIVGLKKISLPSHSFAVMATGKDGRYGTEDDLKTW